MSLSFKSLVKSIGNSIADNYNAPKQFRRMASEIRSIGRLFSGKGKSNAFVGSSSPSSARHLVGNTGFHRAYPSIGVKGAY